MEKKKEKVCRACGSPFLHIKGTNIIACSNPSCDGKEYYIDEQGNKKYRYLSTYFLMDSKPLKGGVKL